MPIWVHLRTGILNAYTLRPWLILHEWKFIAVRSRQLLSPRFLRRHSVRRGKLLRKRIKHRTLHLWKFLPKRKHVPCPVSVRLVLRLRCVCRCPVPARDVLRPRGISRDCVLGRKRMPSGIL